MDTLRTVGLVSLGVILFVSLVTANAAIALDRTAFDSGFAKEQAEEADLYQTFGEAIRDQFAGNGTTNASNWPLERSRAELISAAITDEYLKSQGEKNIDAIYAYLHGETDELKIAFDTEPLKQNLVDEIEREVENIDLATIMPSAEEIDTIPDSAGIEEMASSQTAFEKARADFRAKQKARIQAQTDRELSDQELETRLDAAMGEIRSNVHNQMDTQLEGKFEGQLAELEEPVRTLQTARIDALTGAMTYEEYSSTVETAKADLADAIASMVKTQIDENIPDTIDVTDQLTPSQRKTLENARSVVSIVRTLAIVLPIFALVVVAAIMYVAARSIAALEIGAISLASGGIGAIGSRVAAGRFREAFDPATAPPGVGEFLVNFVTGTLGVLTRQSVVLAVVGIVVIGIGMAIRFDYVPETIS